MNFNSLIAEHSINAGIVIERRPAEQSINQQTMTEYDYQKDGVQPNSNVNHADYRIVNLPDTIAYIPKNSVFENIILFHSSYADFRFVPINRIKDGMKTTDNVQSVVIGSDLQPVDPYNSIQPARTSSMLTSTLDIVADQQDPKFANIANVANMDEYNIMLNTITGLINRNNGNVTDASWIQGVYQQGKISRQYVDAVMATSPGADNASSIEVRLIESIKNERHDANLTVEIYREVYVVIKNFVLKYAAAQQRRQEDTPMDTNEIATV